MNVIFMGTPEFAVPSLKKLLGSANHKVTAVFSQVPRAAGRGMRITDSPVSQLAKKHDIRVYTPLTMRGKEVDKLVRSIKADIIVVVAYGFIIPDNILKAKKYGCLNIHPSRLPKYRGAAPLQRTIINGEKETAVCVMQMDEGLDTGDILLQQDFAIADEITFTELHDKCASLGADMLIQTLDDIDIIKPQKQAQDGASYARKLSREESKINWSESALSIERKIRGMNPWPGIYFECQGKKIKIIAAKYIDAIHAQQPGMFLNAAHGLLEVTCGYGALRILKVQPEGKRVMEAMDYLRGLQGKDKIMQFG